MKYIFLTEENSQYDVTIKPSFDYLQDSVSNNDIYGISFNRDNGCKTDPKINCTICKIIDEWFNSNDKVLTYVVSDEGGMANGREKLFNKWNENHKNSVANKLKFGMNKFDMGKEKAIVGIIHKEEYSKKETFNDDLAKFIHEMQTKN